MKHRKVQSYNAVEGYGNAVVWYVVAFACLMSFWWMMKWSLAIDYPRLLGSFVKSAGDVALVLLPYWLLRPRWRWTPLILLWILPFVCVANLAYFRFWGDLIPPASVTMGGNVDGNLMEYGFALLRWTDLLFIIPPCFAWLVYRKVKPWLSPSIRPRWKCIAVIISVLAGVAGQAAYLKTSYSLRSIISPLSIQDGIRKHFAGEYNVQKKLYEYNGPLYYSVRFIIDAILSLNSTITLTDAERQQIAGFIDHYRVNTPSVPIDSISSGDIIRSGIALDSLNVVYIIVESLNSDMVGRKIDNVPVMPVLDSLSRQEGTVVFDNVVSQIKASSSSDGHLLLMTGLLPPDKVSYSITYGSVNTFPSLGKMLGNHHKYLLLADDGVCWNEGNTLRNFGLGDPLVIKDREAWPVDKYARDGAMFLQAKDMLRDVRQPFFMTLMTISMHIPFREDAWPLPEWLRKKDGLTQQEKDYANMCMMTDRAIGDFLAALPSNTVVFIASDHHQDIASQSAGDTRAFFMALNTGITERVSRTVGQVNLFPAALDILGLAGDYRGMAPSAFDGRVDGAVDSYGNNYGRLSQEMIDTLALAYRLSDLIIRGDYFRANGR